MARQTVAHPLTHERRLRMSYDEFLAWSDEDTHAEWVDGEVIVFVPPTIRHQELAMLLSSLLSLYIHSLKLGVLLAAPCEMRATPGGPAREPDLLFVSREHADRLTDKRVVGPADLVIEIVSDSSSTRDSTEKFHEYQAAGVREYWLFDPRPGNERASFYRLTAEGKYEAALPDAQGRYHAAVLPGFWLRPDWLWQDPLPDPLALLATIAPQALRDALSAVSAAPPADASS